MKWMQLKYVGVFLLSLLTKIATATPTQWQSVAPGLEYAKISGFANYPNGSLHALRIDLKHYDFRSVFTQQDENNRYSVAQLMRDRNAVIATNGGFFTPEFKPLGLRINQGQQLNPLRAITWWGVFFIQGERARIVAGNKYRADAKTTFAIQTGPRLIANGVIPAFKPDIDYRTALGIARDGHVILVATENVLLSMTELANIMAARIGAGGLDCVDALNLDGGHSTQLYVQLGTFSLQIPGYLPVVDAVLVIKKESFP